MVVRKVFNFLPYPDAILKREEQWEKRGKQAILRERIDFLDRKGQIFDLDNDGVSELEVVDEHQKLLHTDVISKIPGIDTEDTHDKISRSLPITELIVLPTYSECVANMCSNTGLDTSLPIVITDHIFIKEVIDANKNRTRSTIVIGNTFSQAENDERILVLVRATRNLL
jgi:hypothetical protein